MRKLIDISLTISKDLCVWPGDPPVHLERALKMEEGDSVNVTNLRFGAHTGTHLDAPYHFLMDGGTVDQIDLDTLIGRVFVMEIPPEVNLITVQILKAFLPSPAPERILFKTRNSTRWQEDASVFDTDYVALDAGAAGYLVNSHVRLVGIDYLSIAPYDNVIETHQVLLSANLVILEGLNLHEVKAGEYLLLCLPLKIKDSDGAPMRAVLAQGDLLDES